MRKGLILVTGATGFVGAAVARHLAAAGHRLRLLVRPEANALNLAGIDAEIVSGDLTRPDSLAPAVAACTAVFHVAADYRLWVPDPAAMDRVNIAGTRDLLRASKAAGVERIIYTSSVATLKPRPGGVADEDSIATLEDMIGAYKRSKYLAEREVDRLVREESVPAIVVLPSTPVGPGDVKPTPTGRMILEAARGRLRGYVATGLNIAHVDDIAAGHVQAWRRGAIGRRYILGGENLPLRDILTAVARHAGRRPPMMRLAPGPLWPLAMLAETYGRISGREPMLTRDALKMARTTMYFSSERAERELGYAARPAEQALSDAVAWFRAQHYLE